MVTRVAGRAARQLCGAARVWGTAATAVAGRRGAGQEPGAAHRLARHTAQRTTVRVGDPADTVPHRARDAFPALPGRRVRHRLTPTNGAGHPTGAGRTGHWCWAAHLCRGEAPPRPPAPSGAAIDGGRHVSHDTSADQPSARIHDRPAVNGWASAPGAGCRPPRQRWSRHHRTLWGRPAGPAGPAGQAPPDPYKMGIPPHRGRQVRHR